MFTRRPRDYGSIDAEDVLLEIYRDMNSGRANQHCIIAHQPPGEEVKLRTFSSPEDAIKYIQKSDSGQDRGSMWVDVQGGTEGQGRRVLQQLFPGMQPSQVEAVLAPEAYDVVELQPVRGQYLVGSLACAPDGRGCAPDVEEGEDAVICAFACNEEFIVTLHSAPFAGLAELLQHVEVGFCAPGKSMVTGAREMECVGGNGTTMTGAAVLCALVCFTCETCLPNPTSLISEVDCIDEMVLLVAPGKRDQADLLRRVSVLRRRISCITRFLYVKEKLLQELMGPTMRTTFVSRDVGMVNAYRDVMDELSQILERLEYARDTLNHANLNFMNAISMRMSQSSARLDKMMTVLSQIATICLPANLIASIFGMNCKVAWVANEYDNLNAFWGVLTIILVWMILCLYKPMLAYFRTTVE